MNAGFVRLERFMIVPVVAILTLIPSPATAGEGGEPSTLRVISFTREAAYA